jgi:hypothetical protein
MYDSFDRHDDHGHRPPPGVHHEMHDHHHDHHDHYYGDAHTPVQMERILKTYPNPDGSPSRNKYYLYPITCFKAVHVSTDIHSATLEEIIDKWDHRIKDRQKAIASGSEDTILVRGKDDGDLRELYKVDYVDENRTSKRHIPSEFALYRALGDHREHIVDDFREEAAKIQRVVDRIHDNLHTEERRAQEAEHDLGNEIHLLSEQVIKNSIVGNDGYLVQNMNVDLRDLSNVQWKKTVIYPSTGTKETKSGFVDLLTPIMDKVGEYIDESPIIQGKVDASVFESTNDSVIASQIFEAGTGGSFLAAVSTVIKNIKGAVADVKKVLSFHSETLQLKSTMVDSNETQIDIEVRYASDAEVAAMLNKVYA